MCQPTSYHFIRRNILYTEEELAFKVSRGKIFIFPIKDMFLNRQHKRFFWQEVTVHDSN